jgi:hypothetical protein
MNDFRRLSGVDLYLWVRLLLATAATSAAGAGVLAYLG